MRCDHLHNNESHPHALPSHRSSLACVFLKPRGDTIYLSKFAVAPHVRGRGHAATLVQVAKTRAVARGLMALELDVRIALIENHQVFKKLGFEVPKEGVHAGFNRTTYFTMRQKLS